ncbi:MAG: FAD-dependent monooxygenase, partial [Nanoarchaeota archaeon]|nr:FAD-dependent monooxygenase [Nanoarchaeota archaeon]
MYDVIIVGAGPVGLYTAKLCKNCGINVIILEEHGIIGEPDHCSGLISTNVEDFVKIDSSWLEHEIKGAVIRSGSGKNIPLTKNKTAAYVINRAKFDRSLSKGLEKNIVFNECVEKISIKDDFVEVKTKKEKYKAKMIIGCDGFNSIVAKSIGSKPNELVNGIISIIDEKDNKDIVELWFDKKVAKDGFLWKIPRGKTTEYGMMSSGAKFEELKKFFKLKSLGNKKASMIPIGPSKTYSNRALLIG